MFAVVDEQQIGTAANAEGARDVLGGMVDAELILAGHEVEGIQRYARIGGECGAVGLAAHLAVAMGQRVDGSVDAIAHDPAQATTGMRLHGFFLQ